MQARARRHGLDFRQRGLACLVLMKSGLHTASQRFKVRLLYLVENSNGSTKTWKVGSVFEPQINA